MTMLKYELSGKEGAPVVVLSSSLGTSYEIWDPQVAALADSFRVLRYDHRGHGGSETPPGPYTVQALAGDIATLIDELGFERVSFCGLSIGGAVGMMLAVMQPAKIDRLVLACTSARFGTPSAWQERARVVRERGISAIAEAVLARWFTGQAAPADVERCQAMLERTPAEGYAACCEALSNWDFRSRLGDVQAPTLVIGGAQDPATPLEHSELLAHGTGAPLLVLGGAAHLANVEQPRAFNTALLGHLLTPAAAA